MNIFVEKDWDIWVCCEENQWCIEVYHEVKFVSDTRRINTESYVETRLVNYLS